MVWVVFPSFGEKVVETMAREAWVWLPGKLYLIADTLSDRDPTKMCSDITSRATTGEWEI
jgi:hypothetical protein